MRGQSQTQNDKRKQKVDQLSDVDYVPTNTQSLLYIFEDNEAVIKLIGKGRSPTMRHVSRTHSVALDWTFDRIILEPKIQMRYVDFFSRDERNHLHCLFKILSFSMFSCSHFSDFLFDDQVGKQTAISRRGQEATSNEGSPMAKPRPAIPVKARPTNLVMRNPRSEDGSSQCLEYLVHQENADERKEVEMATRNSGHEEQLRKQIDEREYSNSNCTRNLVVRENQSFRTRNTMMP